jgi:hypothetical protein
MAVRFEWFHEPDEALQAVALGSRTSVGED